jgi:hypothetical protein
VSRVVAEREEGPRLAHADLHDELSLQRLYLVTHEAIKYRRGYLQ